MNFAFKVISGFSGFSMFLFRADGKNLSGCKIISRAYTTTIFLEGDLESQYKQ